MSYGISSRDYLARAVIRIAETAPESLFYAAFELRCGIESRMQEYLDAWDHVTKKMKQGWRISELGRSIERSFRSGNTIIRWAIHDDLGDRPIVVFYHTPVTKYLRTRGEKLGNYLHSMKQFRSLDDHWWTELRAELNEIVEALRVANMGTLLGPPLMKHGSRRVHMTMEVPPGRNPDALVESMSKGQNYIIEVKNLSSLPNPIEPEAVLWIEEKSGAVSGGARFTCDPPEIDDRAMPGRGNLP